MASLKEFVCGSFGLLFVATGIKHIASGQGEKVLIGILCFAITYGLFKLGTRENKDKAIEYSLIGRQRWPTKYEKEVEQMVDSALSDGHFTPEEEQAILAKANQLQVPNDSIASKKLWQARYYRDLVNGASVQCPVPWPAGFLSEPGERHVWTWDAEVMEWNTSRTYVGDTAGMSFRVAKGVTLRTGGVRGHFEKNEGYVSLGMGQVTVTNRAMLVSCGGQAMRLPHKKLVHVQRYADGVAIQYSGRDKPLVVKTFWNDAFFGICLLNAKVIP